MNIYKTILLFLSLLFFCIGIVMAYIPPKQFIEIGSIIAVTLISLPTFYGMYKIYGRRGIYLILALGTFGLVIESIGIHTGWPYSPFEYTMSFGYQLFGTTPWTVFIAWSPLVIGAWLLAHAWFKKRWAQFLVYLGILVGTDIILDPGAVARGLWEYTNGGLWFNVPLQNFIGWCISGTIAYVLLRLFTNKTTVKNTQFLWLGSLSLLLSIFLWSGVNIGYALWLPAIMGIILGTIIVIGLYKKPLHT